MSFGSRANQVNPEALVILFRATTETALFLRVDRRPVSARAVDFHMRKSFFARSRLGHAPLRNAVLHRNDCVREQGYFGD
jgi:hypothetical protein